MRRIKSNAIVGHLSLTRVLLLVTLSIGLWSCGSMRPMRRTEGGNDVGLSKGEFIARRSHQALPPAMEASGSVSISAKGNDVSVGVRMVLTPDQYFELSARPLGFIEAARLMVDAQKGVLAMDRINKLAFREDRINFRSDEAEQTIGINPMILRSMVQNEPFDTKAIGSATLKAMRMEYIGGRYHFISSSANATIDHYFSAGGELVESIVSIPHKATIIVKYADFVILTSGEAYRPYPRTIMAQVTTNEQKTYGIVLELNRASALEMPKPSRDFDIPYGYDQVTVKELLKILNAL